MGDAQKVHSKYIHIFSNAFLVFQVEPDSKKKPFLLMSVCICVCLDVKMLTV